MRFRLLHKIVTYVIASIGLFALTFEGGLGGLRALVMALVVIATWFAEEPLLSTRGYRVFWNRAVVGVFAVQAFRAFAGASLLDLGIEYAAFLQVSRLAYRRTANEYQQVTILAFLDLIAATVLSTGLDYAVVFLGFVIVVPWMLALTHLRREMEEQYQPGRAHDEPMTRDLARALENDHVAGAGFLFGTTLLAVPLFLTTAIFFFAFPRVGKGFFTLGSDRGERVTVFGSNILFGGFGVIRDDPTVVLRAVPATLPDSPPTSIELRLRGTSFDHYDHGLWSRSSSSAHQIYPERGSYVLVRPPRPDDRAYRILLSSLDEPVLFFPQGTVAFGAPARIKNARAMPRRFIRDLGGEVRYVERPSPVIQYDVYVDPSRPPVYATLSAREYALYLQLPKGQEKVAALAAEVTASAQTPEAKAAALESYLARSGKFKYTLHQPDAEDEDPLDVFLFKVKAGHCEYFSSAMTVMLRTIGVPARNVAGFLGATYNPYGRYYAVRNGDAHSWVEAYIDGAWRTYDPTPSGRAVMASEGGLFGAISELVDALRTRWDTDVVQFDLNTQMRWARGLRDWMQRWREQHRGSGLAGAPGGSGGGADHDAATRAWMQTLGGGALAVLLLGLVLFGAWWLLRGRRGGRGEDLDGSRREAIALYRTLERSLRRAGHPRPPGRTPSEHVDALRQSGAAEAEPTREVTEAYLEARFGDAPIPPERRAHLQRLARHPERPAR